MQQYLWWCDFLDPTMLSQVRETAIANQHKFVPTTVSTGLADYRKSTVLWHYNFLPLYEAFTNRLRTMLPVVLQELGMSFEVNNIELQMTRSGHQEYFKQHNDNSTSDTITRKITYVYYFLLNEPKAFTGGELTLEIDPPATIQPNHNSIVWFPSHLMHEVMPVTCGPEFADGRLTCNGWIRVAAQP